ncbi:MAG: hypothetical protein AAF558_15530 [Verrucomicrobiota bacterium]
MNPDFNVSRATMGTGLLYISDVVMESDNPDPLLNEKIHLIHDDETLTSELPDGRSLFIIRLKDASNVNSFRFYNFGAEGAVTAYVRTTDSETDDVPWIPVSDTVTFGEPGPVVAWFNLEVEAKLVRIVFDCSTPGLISGFGVAGTFFSGADPTRARLVRKTQTTDNQFLTNVLSFGSDARVMGSSPSMAPSERAMIDDLVETSHVFSETEDQPVALIDMGEPREIDRVTVLIDSEEPSVMELYFMDNVDEFLPPGPQPTALRRLLEQGPKLASVGNWFPLIAQIQPTFIQEVSVPPSFFDDNTPNVTVEFDTGERRARASTGGTTFAQYVLVRWIYSDGIPPDFGGLVVNELNFLGKYTWFYEDDPEPPAERPENELIFLDIKVPSSGTNNPPNVSAVTP